MTDPEHDSEQKAPADRDESREHSESAPFWRSAGFAVVAALIALIGIVWRCA